MKTVRIMTLTVTAAALFTAVVMVSAASPIQGGEQFDAGATLQVQVRCLSRAEGGEEV
jgi:hypothetical protein